MSASKTDSADSMEGWSIVRHRNRDDIGSDGDSVEVLSEDSDRDTSSEEDGKDPCDDDIPPDPDTTSVVDASDSNESQDVGDLDSELVALDPLGDLAQRLSNKLQELVLLPGAVSNDPTGQEMKLRYVVIASALLALICSLLISSYLLFFKVKAISEEKQDYSSVHVLQELDQVITKLQTVLQSENEQHLRDILSKMPPGFMNLDKLMIPDEVLRNRKVPMKPSDVSVGSIDGAKVNSGRKVEENGPTWEVVLKSSQESEDGDVQLKNLSQPTPIQDLSQSTSPQTAFPSADGTGPEEKSSTFETETVRPNQAEASSMDPKNENFEKVTPGSNLETVLLSVRQDILSVQKQIYTQIMNSLFEYKIDLYKNLLRSGVDVNCAGENIKKVNHKNFMFIRNLQQMISKSSEANFESWYKFYSFSVLPKIRTIVGRLDSITTRGVKREWDSREEDQGDDSRSSKVDLKGVTDDFFVRAALPNSEPDYEAVDEPKGGFDWKNLDKKIRESLNLKRHEERGDWVSEPKKDRVLKKDSRKNYVELRRGAVTGDFGDDEKKSEGWKKSSQVNRRQDGKEDSEEMKDRLRIDESSRDGEKRELWEETREFHPKEDKYYKRRNGKDERRSEDKKKYERRHEDKDEGRNRKVERRSEDNKNYERRDEDKDEGQNGKDERRFEDKKKYERRLGDKDEEQNRKDERRSEDKKKYEKREEDKDEGMNREDETRSKDKKKYERRHEDKDEGLNRKDERLSEDKKKYERRHEDEDEGLNLKDERRFEGKKKYERRHENNEKYESAKRQQDENCDRRGSKARGRRESYDRRGKRKSFLSNVTKYVKTAASGLWETVEKGIKKVKNYGEAVKSRMQSTESEKPGFEPSQYEEWRKEFVKELKDLIRVVGGNPTINSLYEMPKSVTQFFGEGLSKVLTPEEDLREENVKGPEGVSEDDSPNDVDGGIPATWYVEAAKHRAESRGTYPSRSDPSWFLGLGRHRSYLRRRGIHLDDDGSWFISSAKHRAKMRQRQAEPQSFFQASSKR